MYISPVQVTRTRLQPSQKLRLSGVMKPIVPPSLGADVARGPAGAQGEVGQRPALLEAPPHLGHRHVLVDPVGLDLAHRHHLDHGDRGAPRMRPFGEVGELVADCRRAARPC